MKNGNCMGPITVKVGNNKTEMYQIYNTCPFDVIIQSLSIAYIDSNSYSEYMNASKNQLYKLAINLVQIGAKADIYKKRVELLTQISQKNVLLCGTIGLDARYNVNDLMEDFLKDEPSIFEAYSCNNNKCSKNTRPRLFYPLNLQELSTG